MNTVYNQAGISGTQRDYLNVAGTVCDEFSPTQFSPELLASEKD